MLPKAITSLSAAIISRRGNTSMAKSSDTDSQLIIKRQL